MLQLCSNLFIWMFFYSDWSVIKSALHWRGTGELKDEKGLFIVFTLAMFGLIKTNPGVIALLV